MAKYWISYESKSHLIALLKERYHLSLQTDRHSAAKGLFTTNIDQLIFKVEQIYRSLSY